MIPKVSIVVPVFNAARYLEECLESLRGQTLDDIEIVAVNDGSTDESLSILLRAAELDHRVVVIDQPNSGASVARNVGVVKAKGEFIGFVDSDDVVDPEMYRILVDQARSTDAALVVCGVTLCDEHLVPQRVLRVHEKATLAETFIYNEVCIHSPCNKIIRRTLLEGMTDLFPAGIIMNEDLVAMFKVFLANGVVSYQRRALYKYRGNSASCVRSLSARHIRSTRDAVLLVREFLQSSSRGTEFARFLEWRDFSNDLPYLLEPKLRDMRLWLELRTGRLFDYWKSPLRIETKLVVFLGTHGQMWMAKQILALRDLLKRYGG